jgi:hypothetical protein
MFYKKVTSTRVAYFSKINHHFRFQDPVLVRAIITSQKFAFNWYYSWQEIEMFRVEDDLQWYNVRT